MVIPNSWNSYPLPTRGDDNDQQTYEGVGRVMSQWEAIEFQLSRIYSIFVNDPDGSAMQQYGAGRIFQERVQSLISIAEQYFINRLDQDIEAAFYTIIEATKGFSNRRNEVAHGMVFLISGLTFFKMRFDADVGSKNQWALLPPYYLARKHDDQGYPLYAYTSPQLLDLSQKLFALSEQVGNYRLQLFAPHCVESGCRNAAG